MEWSFQNAEPATITAVVSAIAGGLIGLKIGISKKQIVSQKAGVYIGTRKLSRILGEEISISVFYNH